MSTNWNGIQSPKEAKTKQSVPLTGTNPRYLAGGSWKADGHKSGVFRVRSKGGARKSTMRTKFRIGVGIYKDKIFSPVVLRIANL